MLESEICLFLWKFPKALGGAMVKKGKGYRIRLYSPYRWCWSPFLGPSARKCNGGLGANHPVLSHTLSAYLLQISPGTHLELGRLWLRLQSQTTDPRPKLISWVHWDSNPYPLRQRILNPAHQLKEQWTLEQIICLVLTVGCTIIWSEIDEKYFFY